MTFVPGSSIAGIPVVEYILLQICDVTTVAIDLQAFSNL
jgi:hypothetical protein